MSGGMKLYVWEDVLCDWTCGIAFALASSKKEVIAAISDHHIPDVRNELENAPVKVYYPDRNLPIGFAVWGGG